MQAFFGTPFLFWYGFVFMFLLCTGAGALVQCWFLIRFSHKKGKKSDYIVYLIISYVLFLSSVSIQIPTTPMLDTLIGAGVLFVFASRKLRLNYIQSAIGATLTMAVTSLVESTALLLESSVGKADVMTQPFLIIQGLFFPVVSFVIFRFIVHRYSVKEQYQTNYLLAFSLPVLFISVILRIVNFIRLTDTKEGLSMESARVDTYEMVILTVIAFLCILTVLFAYEKTVRQIESDSQKSLLRVQISVQQNYVAEAKKKYETTKAFRHDFKNHIVALRGLLDAGDTGKAAAYMGRFEQTYQEMTFAVNTGNDVLDILLTEKLSLAEQMGIRVKCDITVPGNVKVDDFDLCAIFANAIDNAVKACGSLPEKDREIDIAAKPQKNFFIIDIFNPYQAMDAAKGSGMGLNIIQIIAEKYNGAVEICDTDNFFRISVILPFAESEIL